MVKADVNIVDGDNDSVMNDANILCNLILKSDSSKEDFAASIDYLSDLISDTFEGIEG